VPDHSPPRIKFDSREGGRVSIGAGLSGPVSLTLLALPGDKYELSEVGKPPGGPAEWAELPEYPWGPYRLRARLHWSSPEWRYKLFGLEVSDDAAFHSYGQADTGVSAVGLRAIRVGRLMYDVARELLALGVIELPEDDADRATKAARAATYARAFGANTLDFAAEHVGVSRSTVKGLLAQARERGLFDG
jgi:hypothetical protein